MFAKIISLNNSLLRRTAALKTGALSRTCKIILKKEPLLPVKNLQNKPAALVKKALPTAALIISTGLVNYFAPSLILNNLSAGIAGIAQLGLSFLTGTLCAGYASLLKHRAQGQKISEPRALSETIYEGIKGGALACCFVPNSPLWYSLPDLYHQFSSLILSQAPKLTSIFNNRFFGAALLHLFVGFVLTVPYSIVDTFCSARIQKKKFVSLKEYAKDVLNNFHAAAKFFYAIPPIEGRGIAAKIKTILVGRGAICYLLTYSLVPPYLFPFIVSGLSIYFYYYHAQNKNSKSAG